MDFPTIFFRKTPCIIPIKKKRIRNITMGNLWEIYVKTMRKLSEMHGNPVKSAGNQGEIVKIWKKKVIYMGSHKKIEKIEMAM